MGRLYKPTYRCKKTGKKKTSSVWRYRWWRNGREYNRSLGVRDKRAAQQLARKLEVRTDREAAGLDEYETTRVLPISALVDDYGAELRRRRRSPRYVAETVSRLKRLVKQARATFVDDLTPVRIAAALEHHGASSRTRNLARQQLGALYRWLKQTGQWAENPVEGVAAERWMPTRRRRALGQEELDRLIGTALRGRGDVYLFAATTGLRRSEIALLEWDDVDLERTVVRLRAEITKARKDDELPLARRTSAMLARRKANGVGRRGRVFSSVPRPKTFYGDLERAEILRETAEGSIDFHSLRVTFATSLARAGVSLTLAQRLLRHSTPVLTANVYTRVQLDDARDAVGQLEKWLEGEV